MNRRKFIQAFPLLAGLPGIASSCGKPAKIKGAIIGASAYVGHMLRTGVHSKPSSFFDKEVVIIGAGISGLSAARALQKEKINDFLLLDLEDKAGGNARSGSNEVSGFPWGAHYVPIANNSLTEYIDFLKEANVITGVDANSLPVYNDYHLCFDPQERLYINGRWQEGLIPDFGVPENEKKEIRRFLDLMDAFREEKGNDGKDAFALPVSASSKDEKFLAFDRVTMKEWLHQMGFTSNYLSEYINYCTRDDFGTPVHQVSGWAGIHYFACRKGKAANATHSDVLTWPEGNGWLAAALSKHIKQQVKTGCMVLAVEQTDAHIEVHYYDVSAQTIKGIRAAQCILAVPQFVACRLLKDNNRAASVQQHMRYVPWMVANMKVKNLDERSGPPLSWDNVIHNSESLGYVEATHELVQTHLPTRNLTYYLPLTADSPVNARKQAQARTHEEWVSQVIDELKVIHPNIEQAVEEINVLIWGHAMVQPVPGLIHGKLLPALSASIDNRIHFAHTDIAGISLFEEAFYQGLTAAKKVLSNLGKI